MGGKKRTGGAVQSPPSVSLTRKPHHALFIMSTHTPSVSLTNMQTHGVYVYAEVRDGRRRVKNTLQPKLGKQAEMGEKCEWTDGDSDTVKDGEIQHLCNRPHAKVIQAWSEINVSMGDVKNSDAACGHKWQNNVYKKGSNLWSIHAACLCVCKERLLYWSELHWL